MRIERAVVDTNVLISAALLPQSAPAQIVDLLVAEATLVFSRATFAELETRLWRPKFDRYLNVERRRLILHDLAAIAEWVELPEPAGSAYSPDPNDDMFIHTALYGRADWLISGDHDLLESGPVPGLQILSPGQALKRWQASQ
jgi:uncharacterized protein